MTRNTLYMYVAERRQPRLKIACPADAYRALAAFRAVRTEHFLALTLTSDHEVIAVRIVSMGLLNRSLAHPREVFWWAIHDNAAALIIAHNHPSGKTDPSPEDREITSTMKEAGRILGIEVLDHLVVARAGYYSFLERGTL